MTSVEQIDIAVIGAGLGGAADLPGLRHVNEPASVRDTRARAGLLAVEKAATASRSAVRALRAGPLRYHR